MVVETLAGGRRLVQQRHDQHARLVVVGHQAADDSCPVDILSQLLDAGRVIPVGVRHYRTTLEAFLGHFGPAHGRAPQRLHPGTVNALGEKQFVIDLLEDRQILRIEDVALGVLHDYTHGVAQAPQRLAILQEVLDVRLALRNHLFKAGTQFQARHRHIAQYQSDQCHEQHEQRAMVEYQPFQRIAGAPIEVR
ncbi:hypothetical protein D3C81_839150 [compost metagenome]